MRQILSLLFVLCTTQLLAAKVDTVNTFSASMHKEIRAVVITPSDYSSSQHYPVLYLLHGYSGNYSDWVIKDPSLVTLTDQYHMIIVCPDGDFGSWYIDSEVKKGSKYETYVGTELINWIDQHYSTIANRTGRAITGLSMGGHGALFLAFRHPNTFGAAGSMSGGVDLRPFPLNWDLEKLLGKYSESPERWEKNSVINMVNLLTPHLLELSIDCGAEDFFHNCNDRLHELLLERNIPHDYTVRPGGHTWEYWSNSIQYQALFFHNYFDRKK
ncbi:alpha/beta hydrolase [Chitinophaga sancti]|uniref:Alpha/beta hydrolase family protein n=1 Tax=Chitinophaga sancti TaxID=1004 RepID=A0A1K1SJF1_9BACT|nr:alpha/beta hydrolase family protein [Chitinophaga sancti]WQD64471.1 alpha/beta hydrolase family protein [Chitinophaga sancti]WQG89905.1 alpha/beta hydrolase family protein [Chitinophaga sancti]SFW84410.1 S-formylglutathione hydrolase FrmB [Chitinophaga sancti]